MKKWNSLRKRLLFLLGFSFMASTPVFTQVNRIQVWESPFRVEQTVYRTAELDTTLPVPRLYPEPPYTLGRQNTIHWNSDSIHTLLDPSGYNILFFEVKAVFDSSEWWGFVDAFSDSATFINLPPGKTINYFLRYYCQDTSMNYLRSRWSDSVRSIQDVSPPVVSTLEIIGLLESGLKKWINTRTIQVRVSASDPDSGQVMQIAFREEGPYEDRMFRYDIEPPRTDVEMVIPYPMYAEEHQRITLQVWVVDVAGQVSAALSKCFFWWEYEDIVSFPNPFFPDRGEVSTITVEAQGVTEARIFDPFGDLVKVLKKDVNQGFFEWDGRNSRGEIVSKGGYLCILQTEERRYCKIAVLR
jgi:hypothetical protein